MSARFFRYGAVSVGSSPTLIATSRGARTFIRIYNNGSNTVFVGDVNVTKDTGLPIPQSTSQFFHATTALYGVTASSTSDVRFAEEAE